MMLDDLLTYRVGVTKKSRPALHHAARDELYLTLLPTHGASGVVHYAPRIMACCLPTASGKGKMPDLPKKPHAPQGIGVVNHSANTTRDRPETRARACRQHAQRTHKAGVQQDSASCGVTTRAMQGKLLRIMHPAKQGRSHNTALRIMRGA